MHIAMIGSGYVGLVSGACLADFGHKVTCVDKDQEKISALNRGAVPIFEPGLNDLIANNMRGERLTFTSELTAAVAAADAVFIAVGTPSRRGDGHSDLSYVYSAAREIATALDGFTVVITKSTVPVGTGDEVARIPREARPDADVAVVSNPEFLREGAAIQDFKHPDRIVVGVDDERARKLMAEIYRPLYINKAPILYTGPRSAELIKYAANAFLATKITFINEMADLAEEVGADVQDVAHGIGLDNRIGSKFLHAGPGFGGSCFPKDTRALLKTAQDRAVSLRIVEAVIVANDIRKRAMARKVSAAFGGSLRGKTIAVLGLTFKPMRDDMCEAFHRSAPASLACHRLAPSRLAPKKSVPARLAPRRLAPARFTFLNSWRSSLASLRSQWVQERVSWSCLSCAASNASAGAAASATSSRMNRIARGWFKFALLACSDTLHRDDRKTLDRLPGAASRRDPELAQFSVDW
jgi:UDPglucose 6-dehydrogenase